MTYKLLKDALSNKEYGAIKIDEQSQMISFIFDPDNTDYQAYLKWVAEGNTPLPAEEAL